MRGLLLYLFGFSCCLRALAMAMKIQVEKKIVLLFRKILLLNSFVDVGATICKHRRVEEKRLETLADVAPTHPWNLCWRIKSKGQDLKRWQLPRRRPPLPIPPFFHFPLLLRTLCLSVPCLPTFLLPQSPWLIN